jgi:hypothetical protein
MRLPAAAHRLRGLGEGDDPTDAEDGGGYDGDERQRTRE